MKAIPIGKWEVIEEGNDVAVLAVGPMVELARQAAGLLREKGISLHVINARFLKPLDEEMLLDLAERNMSYTDWRKHRSPAVS